MILEVDAVTTRYGALTALHDVSLHVAPGELIALVGPNGAGKTTLLSSVVGLLQPASGRVRFEGNDITGTDPAANVAAGLALVPERRRIFKDLTVAENLRLAGATVEAIPDAIYRAYVRPNSRNRAPQHAERIAAHRAIYEANFGVPA